MRYLLSRILLFVILISVEITSEGATSITATNRLPDPVGTTFAIPFGNNGGTDVIAQTFTAEIKGRLLSASVTAASLDPDPTGLQLALTALENGQPGAILAAAPLQGLYVTGRFTDIEVLNAVANFDADQVMLEDQQQYALLFVAERFPSSYQVLGDQTIGTNREYIGGAILRSRSGEPFVMLPGGDLVFEVTVEAVPEPSTLLTLALAGMVLTGSRLWRPFE
jgi:hypothetical protein